MRHYRLSDEYDAAIHEDTLMLMQKHLSHRGPDANGHYLSMHTGIAMTRLAIVDLDHGNQPLFSTKGVALVANGEIYNAVSLTDAHRLNGAASARGRRCAR